MTVRSTNNDNSFWWLDWNINACAGKKNNVKKPTTTIRPSWHDLDIRPYLYSFAAVFRENNFAYNTEWWTDRYKFSWSFRLKIHLIMWRAWFYLSCTRKDLIILHDLGFLILLVKTSEFDLQLSFSPTEETLINPLMLLQWRRSRSPTFLFQE